ncbi:hypothetical protein DPMN_180911 [Dreissena polymorpha]|uniref:Uncharacterized protein n=1 Tax=Dreissena polymorpha TaxID=45954 RepID=A0A9D4DD82_DREPO|nr:hypothetical protein DPMN_180911 [Dreissena polymorpha]
MDHAYIKSTERTPGFQVIKTDLGQIIHIPVPVRRLSLPLKNGDRKDCYPRQPGQHQNRRAKELNWMKD